MCIRLKSYAIDHSKPTAILDFGNFVMTANGSFSQIKWRFIRVICQALVQCVSLNMGLVRVERSRGSVSVSVVTEPIMLTDCDFQDQAQFQRFPSQCDDGGKEGKPLAVRGLTVAAPRKLI